jgi:hypothetical protein
MDSTLEHNQALQQTRFILLLLISKPINRDNIPLLSWSALKRVA